MRFELPDWLYEPLPYFYIGSGALTLYKLSGGIATFSGGVLVSAGIVVWYLRRDYRAREKANESRRSGNSTFSSRFADSGHGNSWFGDSRIGEERPSRSSANSKPSGHKKVRKPS